MKNNYFKKWGVALFALLFLGVAQVSAQLNFEIDYATGTNVDNGSSAPAPRYWRANAGIGALLRNNTGSSAVTAATASACPGGTNNALSMSSSTFTFRTDIDNVSSFTIVGQGTGNNRTLSSVRTSTASPLTDASYSAISYTATSGFALSSDCSSMTITPTTPLAAGTYVQVTFSGNINITKVILTTSPICSSTLSVPGSLSASNPTDNGFTPSWTTVANAVSYTVKVYQSDNLVFTKEDAVSGVALSNTDIRPGTVTTFTVTAIGNGTTTLCDSPESAPSSSITTTGTIPSDCPAGMITLVYPDISRWTAASGGSSNAFSAIGNSSGFQREGGIRVNDGLGGSLSVGIETGSQNRRLRFPTFTFVNGGRLVLQITLTGTNLTRTLTVSGATNSTQTIAASGTYTFDFPSTFTGEQQVEISFGNSGPIITSISLCTNIPTPVCTAINTAFDVTTSATAVCAGVADATIGLSGSENNVSYKLYKDSETAAIATVAGNGGAISFGTYAEGIYSVKGFGTGEDFCEEEVAMTGATVTVGTDATLCTEPLITVSTTSLDFGTVRGGQTATRTFTVTGMNLTEDITIGYPAGFSGALSADADANQETITVTFTAAGDATFSGNITLSSSGENVTVSVSGVSDATAPTATTTAPSGQEVAISSTITVTFNENIAIADASGIKVNGVEAGASVEGNVLTITVPGGLQNCFTYNVEVAAAAIADLVGNVTASATSFSFRTAEASGGWSDEKTINLHALGLTMGDLSALLSNSDFTTAGSYNIRRWDNDGATGGNGSTTCIDASMDVLRIPQGNQSTGLTFTFPKGVGTVSVQWATTGNRTLTLSTSVSGVPNTTPGQQGSGCRAITITPNTTESATVTLTFTGNGDIQIPWITYTVPLLPLAVEGNENQNVRQGAAIEEITFTAANANAKLSIEWGANGAPDGISVGGEDSDVLNIFGTVATGATPGDYPYTVILNECTSITGTITVVEAVAAEPLKVFTLKWSTATDDLTDGNHIITHNGFDGEVVFASVSIDATAVATQCLEVYFALNEEYAYGNHTVTLQGISLQDEILPETELTYDPSFSSTANYLCFGTLDGWSGIINVYDTSSQRSLIASYSITIPDNGTTTNVNDARAEKIVKNVNCYTVTGVEVPCNVQGIIIKRITYTDGSTNVEKELK